MYKPDRKRITKLIKFIDEAAAPRTIRMSSWSIPLYREDGRSCGTAFCIAGWATEMLGYNADLTPVTQALEELIDPTPGAFRGVGSPAYTELHALYAGFRRADDDTAYEMDLDAFDALPHKKRKEIVLNVLKHFRKTGEVRWDMFAPRKVFYSGLAGVAQ